MKHKKYSHIFWDWNGTLLDDVKRCMSCINTMVRKRGLPLLESIRDYQNVFGFPIIDYYRRVGFDFTKESFEVLAVEYIDLYHEKGGVPVCLFSDVKDTLKSLHEADYLQVVLSASAMDNLLTQIYPYDILSFFDGILGVSDIYAKSKVDIGRDYMSHNPVTAGLMVGDTVHDYEVAVAMGIDCVLVDRGHQSREQLRACSVPIFDDIASVRAFLVSE